MRVRDVMTEQPVTVAPEMELKELAKLLDGREITGAPVVEDGTVVGIVSKADVVRSAQVPPRRRSGRRHGREGAQPGTVAAVMSSPPVATTPHTCLAEAAELMTKHHVGRLPVVDAGELVGIVTRSDLVRAYARSADEIRREIVEEVLPSLQVAPEDVVVEVTDGTVTIRGAVETEIDARYLPRAVRSVPGVAEVDAQLTYRHRAVVAQPAPF